MSKELVTIPELGGAHDVEVIEVPVSKGDVVEKDQTLVVLETDKASMDFPSPYAGRILAVKVKEGDSVTEGDAVVEMELEGAGEGEQGSDTAVSRPATDTAGGDRDSGEAVVDSEAEPGLESTMTGDEAAVVSVVLPDLGGADEVEVIEVSIAAGDEVAKDDTLVVLETDKASMEFPSPWAGTIVAVRVHEGDRVSEGDMVVTIRRSDTRADGIDAVVPSVAEARQAPAAPPGREAPQPPGAAGPGAQVYAGPAVRKTAREFGIDLAQVSGSGPRGRILKEDVQGHVRSRLSNRGIGTAGAGIPAVPEVDFSEYGPIRVEKRSRVHRVTAENMHRSWLNVPHVTQFDEVDVTDLEDFRKSLADEVAARGVRMTPLPFLLRACAAMLKQHPLVNSSLHPDGESLVYKQYVHIGIAVDTPAGLLVPVVRDVDRKGLFELAEETADLAHKARNRKLSPEQMRGASFSISSLGPIGGTGFTPIVNTPEAAILGVSRLATRPIWDGSGFVPRKMLPLALSYDHRVVNGADAGRFMTDLGRVLADIRRLVV